MTAAILRRCQSRERSAKLTSCASTRSPVLCVRRSLARGAAPSGAGRSPAAALRRSLPALSRFARPGPRPALRASCCVAKDGTGRRLRAPLPIGPAGPDVGPL